MSTTSPSRLVENDRNRAKVREEFANFLAVMSGRYRYTYSKFATLLGEKWPIVRQVVVGKTVTAPLSYVEIHVCEPCQLSCKYCRGQLREVPIRQELMQRETLLGIIEHAHSLNPSAFIRLSGTIGEPLLHPHIREAFARMKSLGGLRWGLTTNGLLLNKEGITELLMAANYVHVSLDAGSDLTYQKLKAGRPGDFEKVLANLESLTSVKRLRGSIVEIVVSFVIQDENYFEIPAISKKLKALGVQTFELKMQHFDERRHMKSGNVHEAYDLIRKVQSEDDSKSYRVVVVQSEDVALVKIRRNGGSIDFPRCFANQLGLNATVDPRGNLQTCCQYYQRTLGTQGRVSEGLRDLWRSPERARMLQRDPRGTCVNCSPSDEFVNRFVAFLCKAHAEDPSFLSWIEEHYVENPCRIAPKTAA